MMYQTKETLLRPDWRVVGLVVAIGLVIFIVLAASVWSDKPDEAGGSENVAAP